MLKGVTRIMARTDLVGMWWNELGSRMIIESAENGELKGRYETFVGNASCFYPLSGRYDASERGKSLGWTVAWNNSHNRSSGSTTTWSGQYQVLDKPYLLTTWLLTAQTKPKDDWNSTHIGSDTFTKERPAEEIIEKAMKACRCSHPKSATVSSSS